tara:strand:+ start:431 stop:958 length:528 start_codon:yes stop_codon:yes gene_type:complete
MNVLNENFAIVTPPRCGTRWVLGIMENILGKNNQRHTHSFDLDLLGGRKLLMMVRNPYHRLRSIFRWQKTINNIDSECTWEEFVLGKDQNHTPVCEMYGENKINLVDHFINLEKVNEQIKDIMGIELPPYNNEYFDNNYDDNLSLDEAYSNPKVLSKVNKQFKGDFDLFQYKYIT